jgi:hypothetical protein
MKNRKLAFAALALALGCWSHAASGQATFSTGSTGADGEFAPTTNQTITVRPGGVYNYTTVNIPSNVTVTYVRNTDNAPLVILATGDVTIQGTLTAPGQAGFNNPSTPHLGGAGGPGGFPGGMSGYPVGNFLPTAGFGPGGGVPASETGLSGGSYGAPSAFAGLIPLFGGSGGGGGSGFGCAGCSTGPTSGASGGGGGGAILIASNTRIQINGRILANGGPSVGGAIFCSSGGGPGSGGAIRLVAPTIAGFGANSVVQAIAGPTSGCNSAGSPGRIRMEANSIGGFIGLSDPVASVVTAPGPVSPVGSPPLFSVPTLAIASVGGLPAPASQFASYSTPDIALPVGTANPVPVVVNLTSTPVGSPTEIRVRLLTRAGPITTVTVPATAHTGTFENSTATANVTLPVGSVTVLNANAAMTLTGVAATLFPLIAGEPVERVMVSANMGEASTVSLVTRSGREVRLDELAAEDRTRASLALAMLGR